MSVSRRVLIVDHSVDSATNIAMTLRLLGHEIRTAFNGQSALATAEQFQPDVILVDIGTDGYDVAKRFRALEATKGSLIIALTGYSHREDHRVGLEAGFDDYQPKPVSAQTLGALLAPRVRH